MVFCEKFDASQGEKRRNTLCIPSIFDAAERKFDQKTAAFEILSRL